MNGDLLLVETPQARGFVVRRTPPVEITVRMPVDSRVEVQHRIRRRASAPAGSATAEVKTASGDVRVDDVAGDLNRNSASGDTQFARSMATWRRTSASGDVRGGYVGGNMTSRSASGDTTHRERSAARSRHSRASGDIKIGSIVAGTARVSTASGDVELGVAQGTSVWLDLSSVSGATVSDLNVS